MKVKITMLCFKPRHVCQQLMTMQRVTRGDILLVNWSRLFVCLRISAAAAKFWHTRSIKCCYIHAIPMTCCRERRYLPTRAPQLRGTPSLLPSRLGLLQPYAVFPRGCIWVKMRYVCIEWRWPDIPRKHVHTQDHLYDKEPLWNVTEREYFRKEVVALIRAVFFGSFFGLQSFP